MPEDDVSEEVAHRRELFLAICGGSVRREEKDSLPAEVVAEEVAEVEADDRDGYRCTGEKARTKSPRRCGCAMLLVRRVVVFNTVRTNADMIGRSKMVLAFMDM